MAYQGKFQEAIVYFNKIFEYNKQSKLRKNLPQVHLSLAVTLSKMGKSEEASKHFQIAIQDYKNNIKENPDSVRNYMGLADVFAETGDFKNACDILEKVIEMNPNIVVNYLKLTKASEFTGDIDKTIETLKKGIEVMKKNNRREDLAVLQQHLNNAQLKKVNQKN